LWAAVSGSTSFSSLTAWHPSRQLTAFELALRDADIEQQNLVTVSSILPPHCEELTREAGVATLRPGEITFCVMARTETNEPGRRIHSSIGLARPSDTKMYGYISKHGYGRPESSGEYAEDLAASMLASTLGIEFDPNATGTTQESPIDWQLISAAPDLRSRCRRRCRPLDLRGRRLRVQFT
jgi:pyruvoyl-dependent arginine decarboxylase